MKSESKSKKKIQKQKRKNEDSCRESLSPGDDEGPPTYLSVIDEKGNRIRVYIKLYFFFLLRHVYVVCG